LPGYWGRVFAPSRPRHVSATFRRFSLFFLRSKRGLAYRIHTQRMSYPSLMYAVSILYRALQGAENTKAKKRNRKSTACILYASLTPNSQEFESAVISVNQWRKDCCCCFSCGLLPMARCWFRVGFRVSCNLWPVAYNLGSRSATKTAAATISATNFLMITKHLDEKVAR